MPKGTHWADAMTNCQNQAHSLSHYKVRLSEGNGKVSQAAISQSVSGNFH